MSEQQPTGFGENTLAQVSFIVRDIEAAAKRWAEVLNVPVPQIITTAPGLSVSQTFRGEPSDAQAKLAFFRLGSVQLELIEPIGDAPSAWHEGLEKNGDSFHHLAFWVENMPERARQLQEHGISLEHRGDMGDGQFAYFDATEQLGVTVELLEKVRTEGRVEA
ncbi:MAG: VOC family protein [Armatimonadaceae bacterium]